MKYIHLVWILIPTFMQGYEFTASVPRATQRTTENVLYKEFPISEQTNRTEQTLLQAQPMLDIKINTETEDMSDRTSDGEKILLDIRRADPRFITPDNVNLPLLPSSNSLRNPNAIK